MLTKPDEPASRTSALPKSLSLGVLAVVFIAELLLMFLLPRLLPTADEVVVGIADSIVLTLVVSPFLCFFIYREASKRKSADEAMAERSRELARSNADLEQFAYAVSHDLREPLRMIRVFLELLGKRYEGKLDADADDFIAFAADGAARMQKQIADLLDYSRVGSSGIELSPLESGVALERALGDLRLALEESGAVVTHDLLPRVLADESQLVRLFQNLIGNAIKFRGNEPLTVHVGAAEREGVWVFSVRDNGIGIASEHFEKIFLLFKRIYSPSEYPGTGIGLAICKKIVEQHGGRIWVESEPGQGATFYFTLPVMGDSSS
ncbi:MAG TPA: ATP-binding protein [Geobacteraceae bacterium]